MYPYATIRPDEAEPIGTHIQTIIDNRNIDRYIEGFRTLTVTGREVMPFEVEASDRAGGQHGTNLDSKKRKARIITVRYEMKASDNKQFQLDYLNLNQLLISDEDVEIAFTDMPGYVFYGQVTGFEEVPAHSNSITSSFDIYCQDPFLYDELETVLSTKTGNLQRDLYGFYDVHYHGTAPTRFRIYNESKGENGYFGLATADQMFSIGDPEEADSIPIPPNKLVIDEEMDNMTSWRINEIQPPRNDCFATGGFRATKYGSTLSESSITNWQPDKSWHGPSAAKKFYLDELNEEGATSFQAQFNINAQSTSPNNQVFRLIVGILDQNDDFMFYVDLRDGSSRYANTNMSMYNQAEPGQFRKVTSNEGRLNQFHGNFQIRKQENFVDYRLYHIPGSGYPEARVGQSGGWSIDRAIRQPQFDHSGRIATSVFVWLGTLRNEEVYDHLEISQVRVLKKYWDGTGNVTNLLTPGDIFLLDGHSGRSYLIDKYSDSVDSVPKYPVGANVNPGSDVAIRLNPGYNKIETFRSSWYTREDDVSIVFRARYW